MTTVALDPRIGTLATGAYYAFVDGYDQPETRGTLAVVMAALGLTAPTDDTRYTVTLRFQFPAWDETNGISYEGISARSKREAVQYARRMAWSDGHTGGGKGRYTFTAEVEQ